jgi:anthraniloyl-CoA monooxygenase
MDDLVILGGGPGGLYSAILLKRARPSSRVRVFERNRPDDTYGFGVAFHKTTLRNLAEADAPSLEAIEKILIPWDDVHFRVRGVDHRVSGHGFAGCSRRLLLQVLQQRAAELGVEHQFRSEAHASEFPDADLIVAADGANSQTRNILAAHFQPSVDLRPTRFVWLGTTKPLDSMTFVFVETDFGVFVAHAYPHTPSQGTWIVETDPDTFSRAGLDVEDERATARFLESAFAGVLDGHPLLTNRSHWRQFPLISCPTWTKDNLVLLGDAKGTVHYSIGSGTKLAMEDALALRDSLVDSKDVTEGLGRFEAVRRSQLETLQEVGLGSMLWFEQVPLHWPMPPHQFIFSGVTRKGTESYGGILAKAPDLAGSATEEFASASGAAASDVAPVLLPYRLGAFELSNRMIVDASDIDGDVSEVGLVYRSKAPESTAPPPSLLVVDHSYLLDSTGGLAEAAGRVAETGMCGLLIDLTKSSNGFIEEPLPPDESWPEKGGCLGLIVTAPPAPHTAVPLVTAWVGIGVRYVHAAGPPGRAILLADLLRHRLGICTAVSADTEDEANTALAAGRVDLVALPEAVAQARRRLR